ncbi:methionyl-tRNA formyltransferase, partial [bacterium]|nr:methionyl-tRNA formyltransferase [bacterium]
IELDSFKDEDTYSEIVSLKVDIFIVVAFRILPQRYIDIPKFGAVNIHASILPRYRGAAPIQWALMNGDKNTGVSIFQIEKKIDTGKIIYQDKIDIFDEDNFETLSNRLSTLGSKSLLKALRGIELGSAKLSKQDNSKSTKAPKITREMLQIDWSWSGNKINNWIRGLSPWPGMYTLYNKKKLKIFKVKFVRTTNVEKAGIIHSVRNAGLEVNSGDGLVSILELQQEGKKRLTIEEFLKGSDIKVGDYFSNDIHT